LAKRTHPGSPAKAPRPTESKLAAAPESHSGEGSASVLATLQKMEKGRSAGGSPDPQPADEPPAVEG
jgi:hypothetical protein